MDTETLLAEIHGFCASRGVKPTTFGFNAVGDGKFVGRLERGGECLPRTARKVREYIANNTTIEQQQTGATQ